MCFLKNWYYKIVGSNDTPIEEAKTMRKALLVGINAYPSAPLRGCVNDVLLLYKILTEQYSFNAENVNVLTDGEATKANILAGLRNLVKGTKADDVVFFHYSGHGSQVVVDDWTNTDEADGRDEILCPVDLDWNDPIRDHHLGAILKSVPAGVKVVVVLDCCHSGTGLRNSPKIVEPQTENDWVNRFLPPPPSNILSNPKMKIGDSLDFLMPKEDKEIQVQNKGFMVDTTAQGDAILVSGCEDGQTSADAWIGGRYQGALTFLLAQTLVEHKFVIPYRKLIKVLNQKMDKQKFTQNPQLEAKQEYFKLNFLYPRSK